MLAGSARGSAARTRGWPPDIRRRGPAGGLRTSGRAPARADARAAASSISLTRALPRPVTSAMSHEPQTFPSSTLRPPSDRRALAVAIGLFLLGASVLSVILAGLWRPLAPASLPAPPLVVAVPTPAPGSGGVSAGGTLVAQPSELEQAADLVAFLHQVPTHVSAHWEAGFYPIYATAARTFAVNWLLLASMHRQESAFSTAQQHLSRPELRPLLRWPDAVQRHQRPGQHLEAGARLLPLRRSPGGLQPPDRAPPLDLRRLRLDDGRGAVAERQRRGHGPRRLGLGGSLRLLRPRRDGRHLCRPGAGARHQLVPARLLHQLRPGSGDGGRGARRLRRPRPGRPRRARARARARAVAAPRRGRPAQRRSR